MSDPNETPAERPKIWKQRDDKPADPPAENPPTDGPKETPAERPKIWERRDDNPTPDPEPTPNPPSEWPKIDTKRLMDVDVDGDGIPDRIDGRDPILGDDDDLGDIVAGGPPVGQTVAADPSQSTGGVPAPPPDEPGNSQPQDVFDAAQEGGRLQQPTEGVTLGYTEVEVTARDNRLLDDVVRVRDDPAEEGGRLQQPTEGVTLGYTEVESLMGTTYGGDIAESRDQPIDQVAQVETAIPAVQDPVVGELYSTSGMGNEVTEDLMSTDAGTMEFEVTEDLMTSDASTMEFDGGDI